jgi:hypothetical protein
MSTAALVVAGGLPHPPAAGTADFRGRAASYRVWI